MKARLNLTIDNNILESMKSYSQKTGESISEIVEDYFSTITRKHEKKKNIVQLVEELKAPDIAPDADLKDLFYKEQASKHGF
jgi:tripartite-type tricarboxylate transporter receptor subunit TctC